MNEETKYLPILIGKSGTKVHLGKLAGERVNRFGRTEPVIYQTCGRVNTHYINRPVGIAPLPEGTPITCQACLAELAKLKASGLALNLVTA